ncbi:metallophosphoesterase family protein [Halegenticoccus tardaugens]|uniref:metallophosphoesterase family protein n=1 Tax=Halegenticoccus tardaugens TaxID=2071624 RepID=UPI00100BBD83|nr:metallophosphoesterase family protein [Halegenticoccus tardaugens]
MDLAIISDTHVPSRASEIPEWIRERVEAADHAIHAGDFDSSEALSTVEELAGGNLTAVAGNVDGAELDLPEIATVGFGAVEFVVTHGTGDRSGYERRVAGTVAEQGGHQVIGVAGHTHEPMDDVVEGVRILNPGSATGVDPAEEATMMTATVEEGSVDVTLHRESDR